MRRGIFGFIFFAVVAVSWADVTVISVKDHYSKTSIDALRAFFVIWGDGYGPMGHEPIPFEKEADAKKFLKEHKGKKFCASRISTPS